MVLQIQKTRFELTGGVLARVFLRGRRAYASTSGVFEVCKGTHPHRQSRRTAGKRLRVLLHSLQALRHVAGHRAERLSRRQRHFAGLPLVFTSGRMTSQRLSVFDELNGLVLTGLALKSAFL
jgi:hypothetical protein